METINDQYKGYRLLASKKDTGWQVSIGETGQSTMCFSNAAAALTEARRLVDSLSTSSALR